MVEKDEVYYQCRFRTPNNKCNYGRYGDEDKPSGASDLTIDFTNRPRLCNRSAHYNNPSQFNCDKAKLQEVTVKNLPEGDQPNIQRRTFVVEEFNVALTLLEKVWSIQDKKKLPRSSFQISNFPEATLSTYDEMGENLLEKMLVKNVVQYKINPLK